MRRNRSFLSLALILGPLLASVEASEPLQAAVRLKPLMGYVGDWTWHWKDEHGETRDGYSKVTAEADGAFLIDRGGEIQDEKFVCREFNLYYWQPELRALMSAGFTVDDDHGTSFLFLHGDRWVEQSSGFDAQGKLRTHLDQWQWVDHDQATYQETQICRAGAAESDDFKLMCNRVTPAKTQAEVVLNKGQLHDHLQPIGNLAGNWVVEWQGEGGEFHRGRAVIAPDAGGAVLVERLEEVHGDHPFFNHLRIFYWQPESKVLATLTADSLGIVSGGKLFASKNNWVQQTTGCLAPGKFRLSLGKYEWAETKKLIYSESQITENGSAQPDSPKVTYTRAAE